MYVPPHTSSIPLSLHPLPIRLSVCPRAPQRCLSPSSKPIYTALVVLLLASITFPPGLGQLMASRVSLGGDTGTRAPPSQPSGCSGCLSVCPSQLSMKEYLTSLFDNRTWGALVPNASAFPPHRVEPGALWQEWCHPSATIFGTLAFFLLMKVAMPLPPNPCVPPTPEMVSPRG